MSVPPFPATLPATLDSPRFKGKRFADAYKNAPTIKTGATGEHVRVLQQAFIDLKAALPGATKEFGTPHGRFDDELKGVVMAFQQREFPGEVPDGKVGKKTLYRLHQLLPTAGAPLLPLPAGANDDIDALLIKNMTGVLRDAHAQKVQFWFGEFHVTGGGLGEVAVLLEFGKLKAIYDSTLGDHARGVYQSDNGTTEADAVRANRIVMPRLAATGWKDRSYIVHECIHALQDYRSIPGTTAVSEAAAYIGQCMYYRLATGKSLADAVTGSGKAIFEAADPIAVKLNAWTNPEPAEVSALYSAILLLYTGVPDPDYDGIPW